MAIYQQSVFKPAPLEYQPGVLPAYLFGNFDQHTIPFTFKVTNAAQSTTTVTLTVTLVGGGGPIYGLLPVIGQIIGVHGVTAGGGNMNTDYAKITAVSLNSSGVGTISYTVTTSQTVGSTAATGTLVALPYEIPDTVTTTSASIPMTQAFNAASEGDNSRCMFIEFNFTTLPTSCTIQLQAANVDDDTRYQTVQNVYGTLAGGSTIVSQSANAAVVASSAATQTGAMYQFVMCKFLRFKVTAISGTAGIVGTIFA